MKRPQGRNLLKLILAGLSLLMVQAVCGGISATDPRVPNSLNNMVYLFHPFLNGLGLIPISTGQPPLITEIQPTSVSGFGRGGVAPPQIRLYRVKLQGCDKEPEAGELLGETTANIDGTWVINFNFNVGDVVGATQLSDGKESGLSNLAVNIEKGGLINLDDSETIQDIAHETFQPISLTGTSISGACVVLQNKDPQYGWIGRASADTSGKWKISSQLVDGENNLELFLEGLEGNGLEFSILGFTPKMQWPYSEKDINGKYISPLNAWFGFNDYHWRDLGYFHDGIDIGAKVGVPVHAVADGSVFYIQIGTKNWDGGNIILIDHGAWFSVYMHLSKITIKDLSAPTLSKFLDQPIIVKAGDIIGETGSSGLPTFVPHLHLSALRWNKGNLQESLGSTQILVWPWKFGKVMNINPPGNIILGNAENSTDRIQNCISVFNYWNVDWSKIAIGEFGSPSGTEFTIMGKNNKCAKNDP